MRKRIRQKGPVGRDIGPGKRVFSVLVAQHKGGEKHIDSCLTKNI